MNDESSPAAGSADRARWVEEIRRRNEAFQDAWIASHDHGPIDEEHRTFVERFLAMLPPDGRVLDAACGTGRYFGMVLESDRSLLGVDQSGASLAIARERHPEVPIEKLDLHEIPYERAFDGVMCIDALESLPPEDWPVVIERFARALRPRGLLYATVELSTQETTRPADEEARAAGVTPIEGETFDPEDGYYHYYPPLERVRAWLTDAGFAIEDEAEGFWHDDEWAYHHLLARLETPPG